MADEQAHAISNTSIFHILVGYSISSGIYPDFHRAFFPMPKPQAVLRNIQEFHRWVTKLSKSEAPDLYIDTGSKTGSRSARQNLLEKVKNVPSEHIGNAGEQPKEQERETIDTKIDLHTSNNR